MNESRAERGPEPLTFDEVVLAFQGGRSNDLVVTDQLDRLFVDGRWQEAFDVFDILDSLPRRSSTKLGVISAWKGEWGAAERHFANAEQSDHPIVLAARGATLIQMSHAYRNHAEDRPEDRAQGLALLERAVDGPACYSIVFSLYLDTGFQAAQPQMWDGVAEKAFEKFPETLQYIDCIAGSRFRRGQIEPALLSELIKRIQSDDAAVTYLAGEAWRWAEHLGDDRAANDILRRVEELRTADQPGATVFLGMWFQLTLALNGRRPEAIGSAWALWQQWQTTSGTKVEVRGYREEILRLGIRIALELNNDAGINSATDEWIGFWFAQKYLPDVEHVDIWEAWLGAPPPSDGSLGLTSHLERWRNALDPLCRSRFDVVWALIKLDDETDSSTDGLLASQGVLHAATWMLPLLEAPIRRVGEHVAERIEGLVLRGAELVDWTRAEACQEYLAAIEEMDLSPVSEACFAKVLAGYVATLKLGVNPEPEHSIAVLCRLLTKYKHFLLLRSLAANGITITGDSESRFYLALACYETDAFDEAREHWMIYLNHTPTPSAFWNLSLAQKMLGDIDGLKQTLEWLDSRVPAEDRPDDVKRWKASIRASIGNMERSAKQKAKDTAEKAEAVAHRTRVLESLDAFPGLDRCPAEPFALSLVEASSLLALMRGCEINHLELTLGPLRKSEAPFEPLGQFKGVSGIWCGFQGLWLL